MRHTCLHGRGAATLGSALRQQTCVVVTAAGTTATAGYLRALNHRAL